MCVCVGEREREREQNFNKLGKGEDKANIEMHQKKQQNEENRSSGEDTPDA